MSKRLWQLEVVGAIALSIVVLRLAHLQLVRGGYYHRLAEQNRLRVVPDPAPRGVILDRHGRVLASNQVAFRVAIVPQELQALPEVLGHVSAAVGRPAAVLERAYRQARSLAFLPATIVSYVPKDLALQLEETRWRHPGLLIQAETVRAYPFGETAAHILGYLSQPSAEEFPRLKQYGVRPHELVGRVGIERLAEPVLRGRSGGLVVEVDHRARQVREIGSRLSEPGNTVELTLEAPLQSLIEASFGAQRGAAVVLDPRTGEVLAMVSRPGFEPDAFALGDNDRINRYLTDPHAPLLNRATVGVYQPGSIAKLVVAATALTHGVIMPETTIVCPGELTIGDRTFHCWKRDGHGPMRLVDAIQQSCNVYFMTVGRRLGLERLREGMRHAGFGEKSQWPLEAQRGHVPERRLTEGEVAILAIGQSELLITVLEAAGMVSAFASGGQLPEPWIVRRLGGREAPAPRPHRSTGWSAETIADVVEGMRAVVALPGGTGHRAYTPAVAIAAKTGTAQTHIPDAPHGWFVGFCPADEPRAAFAIVTEHGGSGGDLPADIGKAICEYVVAAATL